MKNKLSLCITIMIAAITVSSCTSGNQGNKEESGKPLISLMVWDEKSKEGSDAAEMLLYQTGAVRTDIPVKLEITGTAINGYDFRIRDVIILRDKRESLIIKPVDDLLVEGDESVTVSLIPDPGYSIDNNNSKATVIIHDNELPDVEFLNPCSFGPESSSGKIDVILSKPSSKDVNIGFKISGALTPDSIGDYRLLPGNITIPAGSTAGAIVLNVINDSRAEDDETIIIEIVKAENANIGLNEKHYYTISNDDGEIARSSVYDKIYGILLGSRGGSSLGAVVEGVDRMEEIEKLYGVFNEFLPYNHYDVYWSHPAGATEDGIERQKSICTAIIEKQDRIKAEDLLRIWFRDFEIEDMYFMTQPYDKTLMSYAKWGAFAEDLPAWKYGMPDDLGEHIHLTARVFHPVPIINAGDPEGAIEDTKEIGRLFYENKNDDAFKWGGVYNAAISLAMMPGATVNSVIEGALKYATPEMAAEIRHGLEIADKYSDPMDKRFREEMNDMYENPSSPYYVNKRITKYIASSVYENVTCAFAIFKLTKGNVEQAVLVANNRGRDTDCTAASAGGLAGALTGTTTIPAVWIDQLQQGLEKTPYSNSHITIKATAQGLYRALQNRLRKMDMEIKDSQIQSGNNLPEQIVKRKNYLDLMRQTGVI